MLVDEQHVVLEARVQMRLQPQLHDDRVVVAVDVRVDAVQALEELADEGGEGFGERHAWKGCFVSRLRLHQRREGGGGQHGAEGDAPIRLGNICSLSILPCTQPIRCSTYCGAGILVGRLKFSESCQRYSNLVGGAERQHACPCAEPTGPPFDVLALTRLWLSSPGMIVGSRTP